MRARPSQQNTQHRTTSLRDSRINSTLTNELWYPWHSRAKFNLTKVPIYVSCGYNKGRSGHELKDVATVFLLATWQGWTPCSQGWWESRSVNLFNPSYATPTCKLTKYGKPAPGLAETLGVTGTVIVHRFAKTTYDGLSWGEIQQFVNDIEDRASRIPNDGALLVYLDKSTRVHMHQVWSWEHEGKITTPVLEPVRRSLQARFFNHLTTRAYTMPDVGLPPDIDYINAGSSCFGKEAILCAYPTTNRSSNHNPPQRSDSTKVLVVAIHMRRGDIANAMANSPISSKDFAQRLVNELHRSLAGCLQKVDIHIFTERQGAEDLKHPGLKNISQLWVGASWEHDMSNFINADILVPTQSSLSTWAAHFARGFIIIPSDGSTSGLKHFTFEPLPRHMVKFVNTLKFPEQWLAQWGCLQNSNMATTTAAWNE